MSMDRDTARAEDIHAGRLAVIEAVVTAGLPSTSAEEAIASVAAGLDLAPDELLARVGAAHDPVRFFEALTRA